HGMAVTGEAFRPELIRHEEDEIGPPRSCVACCGLCQSRTGGGTFQKGAASISLAHGLYILSPSQPTTSGFSRGDMPSGSLICAPWGAGTSPLRIGSAVACIQRSSRLRISASTSDADGSLTRL